MGKIPQPFIFKPFDAATAQDLQNHIREVRRLFDHPGIPYHDEQHSTDNKFFRWCWHNLPVTIGLHNDLGFIKTVSEHWGQQLKSSYAFTSLYGPDGVCPLHTDRPQCAVTVDYLVATDAKESPWPIYIDDKPYALDPGEAVLYSGTRQPHYRKPMREDSDATFCDLVFFHFVPVNFAGPLS